MSTQLKLLVALLLAATSQIFAQTPVINAQNTTPTLNEDGSLAIDISWLVIDYQGANPPDFSLVVGGGSNYSVSGTTITPTANYFGGLTVPVSLTNGTVTSAPFNLAVTVNPINDPPTLDAISNVTVNKNAPEQLISLTGITAGPSESQTLAITATSSNAPLFSNISVSYSSPDATGTLHITPALNTFGSATITVKVTDNGSNVAPNVNNYSRTFTFTVNNFNYPPTFDAIGNTSINEDAGAQVINITGISPGFNEAGSQTVAMTASSSNTTLIPDASVSIVYNGTSSTAVLNFTAAANRYGTSDITVTATDSQGATFSQTFTITVNAVNDPPTLNAISNVTVNKNAAEQLISLAGITAGPFETQNLAITASSSVPGLFSNITVNYTSPDATGTLRMTPATNVTGTATITVTVTDNDSNAAPNINNFSRTFTFTVNDFNYPPTFDVINSVTIDEDAGVQTLSVTGISPGLNEAGSQTVVMSATSSNTTLLPNAAISFTYDGTSSIATMNFTPAANRFGTSTITVRATDSQGADFTRTFLLTVNAINDAPTLDAIGNVAVNKNSTAQPVLITGITAGPFETQVLTVTASADHPELFSSVTVNYTSANTTGAILVTPAPNATGTAIITVTVSDNGSNIASNVNIFSRTFSFTINDLNYPPTFDALANATINEDADVQTINITGISPGFNEAGSQTVAIVASSSNTTLMPDANLIVTYDGTSPTATLKYNPAANRSGSAIITVRATDSQGAEFSRTFTVTVNPINDAPTLDAINNINVNKNAGEQLISLAGITAGPYEDQVISITASSSVPGLFSNISVTYTSPNTTGTLHITPVANVSGSAVITVVVTDNDSNVAPNVNNFTRTFGFTISDLNYDPTFDPIDPVIVDEDVPSQSITITGISPGLMESGSQTVQLTATSSNVTLIPNGNINITYDGTGTTAILKITPAANRWGTANITVKATDSQGAEFSRIFSVTVNAINDPPTLDAIANVNINADLSLQTVQLTGITSGPFENQTLTLTASSNNPDLFESLQVNYQNPQTTGSLTFKTKPYKFGTAIITVHVTDNGPDNAPNVNTFARTFNVNVAAVNHAPTFVSQPVTVAIVNELYNYSVEVNDVDPGNVLTLTAITKPSWLALEPYGNGNAALTGTPPAGSGGVASVKLEIRDDQNAVSTQEFSIRVNTRPTINNFSITLNEDEAAPIPAASFSAAFSDADGDALATIKIVALPKRGKLSILTNDVTLNQAIPLASANDLKYLPGQDYFGSDTIKWIASDGLLYNTNAANIFVQVISVNDVPVITKLETTAMEYEVGDGPKAISAEFEVIDVDNTTLEGAEIGFRSIGTSTYVIGTDVIVYNGPSTPGITGTFNAQSGVMTLRGTAKVSDYITAIRSVKYDFVTTLFLSEALTKTVYYTVTDGIGFSAIKEREIKVTDTFEDLSIPSAFTPNDDGANDTWHISNMERYPNTSIKVYNTQGYQVYSSAAAVNDWNGKFGNNLLPPTTYYFIIDLNLPGRQKVYKGPLTLLR